MVVVFCFVVVRMILLEILPARCYAGWIDAWRLQRLLFLPLENKFSQLPARKACGQFDSIWLVGFTAQ